MFLPMGSFSAYAGFHTILSSREKQQITQLEITSLLPLHRYNLVCSPQVAGHKLSLGSHSSKDDGGSTSPLLAEECIHSGESGELIVT